VGHIDPAGFVGPNTDERQAQYRQRDSPWATFHASSGVSRQRTSGCFSIPDRSGHLFRHARRHPRRSARLVVPVGAGRHTDQLGETRAEGAQRRAAHREADLGDTEVATAQKRHGAFDAPGHQVPLRRLAVGEPELPAEVPGRHVRAAGERLDIQRLCILPIDPVADPAQPGKVAQVLRLGGSASHPCSLSIRHVVIIFHRRRANQAKVVSRSLRQAFGSVGVSKASRTVRCGQWAGPVLIALLRRISRTATVSAISRLETRIFELKVFLAAVTGQTHKP